MRKYAKIELLLFILIYTAVLIWGRHKRSGFPDKVGNGLSPVEDGVFDDFTIGLMDEKMGEKIPKVFVNAFEEEEYILKVRVIYGPELITNIYRYKVYVEKVFKGGNVSEGEEIFIFNPSWRTFFEGDEYGWKNKYALNMGFVNFLKKDSHYLVFLDRKIKALDGHVAFAFPEFTVMPAFNYDDTESAVYESIDKQANMNYYRNIKSSEFFCSSQKALDNMYEMKGKFLEKYPG